MPRPDGFWRRWLMMNRWHAGRGNLFHSSIILFEKNVFRAVVLHLGLKSFCECPLNPYVSKAGWKNWLCPPFPFRCVFCTLRSGLHVISVSPTSIFPVASVCLHMSISWALWQVLSPVSGDLIEVYKMLNEKERVDKARLKSIKRRKQWPQLIFWLRLYNK